MLPRRCSSCQNIILVGFMGTGKTSVGKELAERLGREFVDLDDVIEKRAGTTINEIFKDKGEAHFRELEKAVVREYSHKNKLVISAGGGAVKFDENIANLKRSGIMICLKASVDEILNRVKHDAHRPLLNVCDPKERARQLLKEREPLYAKADYSVDTNGLSVKETADKVLELIRHEDDKHTG